MILLVIINTIFNLLIAILINKDKYYLFNNIRKYSSINNKLPHYYHLPFTFKRYGNIFQDALKYKGDHFTMPCNLVYRESFINYLTPCLHQVLSDNIPKGYIELSFLFYKRGREEEGQSIGFIVDVEISSNTNSIDFFKKLELIIELLLEISYLDRFDVTDCYLGVTHKNVGKYFYRPPLRGARNLILYFSIPVLNYINFLIYLLRLRKLKLIF